MSGLHVTHLPEMIPMRRLYVAILAGIVLAVLVSGCTSSNNGKTLQVLSQMYDVSDYHMFRYTGNATFNNASLPIDIDNDIRVWYGDEIYKGVAAIHSNMTQHYIEYMALNQSELGKSGLNLSVLNMSSKFPLMDLYLGVDVYTDKSSNKTLGGHMICTSGSSLLSGFMGSRPILDRDMNESELADIDNRSAEFLDMSKSRAPLTYVGKDNVVFQGRTCECTMYNFTAMDMPYTAWYSPDVPMPLKFKCINSTVLGPMYMTMDLQEWS